MIDLSDGDFDGGTDSLLDLSGFLAIDGAANGVAGAKDLFSGAREGLGDDALTSGAHCPGNIDDGLEGEVAAVFDVLDLLAIADGFLERLEDQGSGCGDDLDGCLSVLDGESDGDLHALPGGGALADVLTGFFGVETHGTEFGGKHGRRADFAAILTHRQVGNGGRVTLGWGRHFLPRNRPKYPPSLLSPPFA